MLYNIPQQFQDPRLDADSGYRQMDDRYSTSYVDVHRSRIRFDGETGLTNFLERIEEVGLSRMR